MSTLNHSFNVHYAAQYGIKEAIVIHYFQRILTSNQQAGINEIDGRTWATRTTEEISYELPYFSIYQIKRIIEKLVQRNVLLKRQYYPNNYDRTNWYAFLDQNKFLSER